MNGSAGGQLQNVLSISTAANNRYLLHFNSLNSLTQWTAGFRLAMYEHATLQEAYTGSLIAGKGKMLNNIRTIMERSKFKTEDWARVRFGAGTPWRRCWCVISPPDEKEYQKAQKTLKKRDTYDRKVQVPKGDIKFYDTRRPTKKTRPIATIKDAFAAYAIYPQSKPLIDQSTLVKLEGQITVHGSTDTTTEGFIFVMPEVHPAVSGFEMMLRWLFPVYDTFALYGRPSRLVADPLDQRGLMFAMPRNRRYGYLDILDVSGLIHTKGSQTWSEQDWRREMKKLTSHRMNSSEDTPPQARGRRNTLASRTSLSLNHGPVRFTDDSSTNSSPSTRRGSPAPGEGSIQFAAPRRVETTPMGGSPGRGHNRSASDALGYKRFQTESRSRLSYEATSDLHDMPPEPPVHGGNFAEKIPTVLERVPSESESPSARNEPAFEELLKIRAASPPSVPVASPPKLMHGPNARPINGPPTVAPELRRANSAMDAATLEQLAEATGATPYTEKEQFDFREVTSVTKWNQRSHADTSTRHEEVNLAVPENSYSTDRRLPPIPASPYAHPSQPSTVPAMSSQRAPPPVPRHGIMPADAPTRNATSPPAVAGAINRKPVPTHTQTPESIRSPPQSPPLRRSPAISRTPSNESLRNELMEQALLEQMLQQSTEQTSRPNSPPVNVVVDDDSDDYDSVKSMSPPKRKPVERVRTGRLKTVGNPEYAPPTRTHAEGAAEIPNVNFGPTLSYKPNGRPTTSGSMTAAAPQEEPETVQRPPSRLTPLDGKRNSYFEARRTPSGDNMDKRRSIAWQPATTPVEPTGQGMTAEQWVQYRASIAAAPVTQSRGVPVYGHGREQSNANRLSQSKTPPLPRPASGLSRTLSGDWTQQLNRLSLNRTPSGDWGQQANRMSLSKTPPPLSRTPSGDWSKQVPSRPHSRNAGAFLNPSSPGRTLQLQSSTLSAHEQMQVARMTGTSMVNLTERDRRKDMNDLEAPGLIGAMAARERQRNIRKQGFRNDAVQQAIAARQQQQLQDDFDLQMRAQYEAQEYAQQQAELQAQQIAHQQAQQYAQQYAHQQAHQAQMQQQMAHQQAQAYQMQVQLQQQQYQQQQYQQQQQQQQHANYPYASGPGTAQSRSSQYLGQMGQGVGWSNAGSPQPQVGYAQSYFGQTDAQHRQSRRYQ